MLGMLGRDTLNNGTLCIASVETLSFDPLAFLFGLRSLLRLLLFLFSATLDLSSSFDCDGDEGEDDVDSAHAEQGTNIDTH